MSCILDSGIPLGCIDSTGGIKRVLIAKYDDSVVFTEAGGKITTIAYASPAETYYTFKFRPQTSLFSEEGGHAVENGTNFWTQTVTMTFHKLETSKRNAILLLAKTDLHVIVETQNGDYWLVGKVNGANLTASTSAAGQAFGDLNGYTITLTGLEPQMATEVEVAAIATLTISA